MNAAGVRLFVLHLNALYFPNFNPRFGGATVARCSPRTTNILRGGVPSEILHSLGEPPPPFVY